MTWVDTQNVTPGTRGSIEKTSGGNAWNAGGRSQQEIGSGGCQLLFVHGAVTEGADHPSKMLGLSSTDPDYGWQSLEFAIQFISFDRYYIYESNFSPAGPFYGAQLGDIFSIEVSPGGTVTYYCNGTLFYTSLNSPNYPIFVDCAIYNQVKSLYAAVFFGPKG